MIPQEHILIFSPGSDAPALFTAALRSDGGITRSFALVELGVTSDTPGDSVADREQKQAFRTGLSRVKELAASLGIPHLTLYIDPPTPDTVTATVLGICRDHPGAQYSVVLAGASVPVTTGLFRMAAWLGADISSAGRKAVVQPLTLPQFRMDDLMANPNYGAILTLLHSKPSVRAGAPSGIPRRQLFGSMKDLYMPLRTLAGRPAHRGLTPGNFSQMLATLIGWGLVAEQKNSAGVKGRLYGITPDGELVFSLLSSASR
jgi:hypothetical protein